MNVNTILKYLDISLCDILDLNKMITKKAFLNKLEEPDWRVGYVKELLHVRDGQSFIDLKIVQLDVTSMLNFMSTFR